MTPTLTLRRAVSLAIPLALFAAVAINAQIDNRPAAAPPDNATALRQYEWKSRTEIRKDGETKRVEVASMRYDDHGQLQKTVIGSTPEPDLPKFGLRRRIAKNKLEDFREKIASLAALAQSYRDLPADRKQRFMTTAAATPEEKLIRLQGRDVLQSGDSMTIFIDAVSRRQKRIEIQTTFDQKPVRIVSEFADLSGGPTYMSRSEVTYDGNSIGIITENFDYTRLPR
jgi:hypothetical protein